MTTSGLETFKFLVSSKVGVVDPGAKYLNSYLVIPATWPQVKVTESLSFGAVGAMEILKHMGPTGGVTGGVGVAVGLSGGVGVAVGGVEHCDVP